MYDGHYENGQRSGYGVYRWKNKARYAGEYLNNKRHGTGLFVYPDGSKYKGDFVAGKREGQGTYLYPNGDIYQGQWANDQKNGEGVYTYANSGSRKRGTWVQGVLNGQGEIIHQDHKVIGNFVSNQTMKFPVQAHFFGTSYTTEILDKNFLGASSEAGNAAAPIA